MTGVVYQGGSTCPLRWNRREHRTEPALPKISRAKARRLRREQAKRREQEEEGESRARQARRDSGLMEIPDDIPLVGQAARGGWGVNDAVRQFVAQRVVAYAGSPDPQVALRAARVLATLNEQQEVFLKDQQEKNGTGEELKPADIIPDLIHNGPDILDQLRAAAVVSDSVAGDVCAPCEPGPVEDGPASSDPGQSGDGHAGGA